MRGGYHVRFVRSDEELVSNGGLRFRARAELEQDLSDAGFGVENVFGDWGGRPADAASPEMIFVAARVSHADARRDFAGKRPG